MTNHETLQLLNKLRDIPVLFKDGISDKCYYRKKPVDIFLAIADLNKIIQEEGNATIENWYDLIGVEYPVNDRYSGWDIDCLIENGETWVDFNFTYFDDTGDPYFLVCPNIYPCDAWSECKGHLYEDDDERKGAYGRF